MTRSGKILAKLQIGLSTIIRLLVGCAILLAAFLIIVDIQDRQAKRVIDGWALYDMAEPNTAVWIRSIEYLHRIGQNFAGLDWSCRTIGEYAKTPAEERRLIFPCRDRPDFSSLDLSARELGYYPFRTLRGAILTGINWENANLISANLESADLNAANFAHASLFGTKMLNSNLSNANFREAEFSGAELNAVNARSADFEEAKLTNSDVTNADFSGANLKWTWFRQANISGADFSKAKHLDKTIFDDVWAWRDQMPKGLEKLDKIELRLCSPTLRTSEMKTVLGVPEGC